MSVKYNSYAVESFLEGISAIDEYVSGRLCSNWTPGLKYCKDFLLDEIDIIKAKYESDI